MIPKVIHYCWFGGAPIPEKYQQYIETWKKFCPEYEIKRWDESNFDVTSNRYCREAYESKQWAFVSDYARLKIIYEHGGIYLDTDVELIKSITPLISSGDGFIGFQNPIEVNSGLGFSAKAGNKCVEEMLSVYDTRKFIQNNGQLNRVPCPAANTVGLQRCGLKIGKMENQEIQSLEGLKVYPLEYFNPLNADTQQMNITKNTYSIHQYTASWLSGGSKKRQLLKRLIPNFILNERVIRISRRDIEKIKEEIKEYTH